MVRRGWPASFRAPDRSPRPRVTPTSCSSSRSKAFQPSDASPIRSPSSRDRACWSPSTLRARTRGTRAGSAPRIGALGWLLSTTGGNASLIDAVALGYRSHVRLTDDELSRLPDSLRAFHFVLDCWGIVYWGTPAAPVAAKVAPARQF